MALQEEPSKQPQGGWFSRYSRERRDLSASVEDALAVSSEQQWEEEDDEVGSWKRSKHRGSLIPPRLSLQSKQIPTVHSGGFVETVAEMQSEAINTLAKTSKSIASTPRVNLLTRVARKITASLVALGSTTYPEAFPALPVSLLEEPQFLSWQHEISLLPPPISQDEVYVEDRRFTAPVVSTLDMSSASELSVSPFSTEVPKQAVEPVTPGARRQRAGHMSKIRLQTASIPATPRPSEQQSIDIETPMPENEGIVSEFCVVHENDMADGTSQSFLETEPEATDKRLPAVNVPSSCAGTTSGYLPTVDKLPESAHNTRLMAFFGRGTIESGQGDITVADPHVTSTGVINVTLTSNPGPVVVQYISLQPLIGFTMHLTAPATANTAFNYVILQGAP